MDLFATYNPEDYSLTGFFINQPLNNFVVLSIETRDYIIANQINKQVFFQNISPGMFITQDNILLKDSLILTSTRQYSSTDINVLHAQVNLLANQVLNLTLALKEGKNATN